MIYKFILVFAIFCFSGTALAQTENTAFQLHGDLRQIPQKQLQEKIQEWLLQQKPASFSNEQLTRYIHQLYLQTGNPNVTVEINQNQTLQILIQENREEPIQISDLQIQGGDPQSRYIVESHLRLKTGDPYNHQTLQEDINWLRKNRFIPVFYFLHSPAPHQISPYLTIQSTPSISPVLNLPYSTIGGAGVTFGLMFNNYIDEGYTQGIQIKRNNIKLLGEGTPNLMQDWEFIFSWETDKMPFPGMSLGTSVYNKVDYIFDHFQGQLNDFVWVGSIGGDVYTGFPIWSDANHRRFMRGIVNMTFLQDTLYSNQPDLPASLSQSGKIFDSYVLPSFTLLYSDLDRAFFPGNGHFITGELRGGVGETFFAQTMIRADSFVTFWENDFSRLTLFLQNMAGTTFGSVPFYRGFLNAGSWFVRGATQYSIFDQSSIKGTQELQFILPKLISNSTTGDWGAMLALFVDEGAYWNRQAGLHVDKWQVGAGIGLELISPVSITIGADYALPVYPQPGPGRFFLRMSVPFGLNNDRRYSNGFFWR